MSNFDVIRAWKDPEYRAGLTAAEQASLPEHPSGLIELMDEELGTVNGAATYELATYGCCTPHTVSVDTHAVATLGCCKSLVDIT